MFKIDDEGDRVEKRPSDEKCIPKILKLMTDYDDNCAKN